MKLLGILLLASIFVSCSKIKELDERTGIMTKKTKQMSKTTNDLKKATNYMIRLKRQNDAVNTRNEQYDILMDPKSGMGAKLTAASVLFKGFEFQLWNPNENSFDTPEFREELKLEAMKELYQRLADVYKDLLETNFWGNSRLENMTPLELDKDRHGINENNSEMVLYAIGTASHFNNNVQELLHHEKEIDHTESMYDIIRHSLEKEANGEALSPVEELVVTGENKDITLSLFRARYNMLLALAVKNVADKEQMTFGNKMSALWYKVTGGSMGSLTVGSKFESSNVYTQRDVNLKFSAAFKTREVLVKLGYEVKTDEDLFSILTNIKLNEQITDTPEYAEFLRYLDEINY